MAESKPSTSSPPVVRSNKPVSEALLNDKWDHAISSLLIRSSLGLSFGVIFSVLLFKRRAWPAFVGLGFGAGRAWEEADAAFKRGGSSTAREGLRLVRTQE
ncbi:Mitochondrial inner membrane organizing system component [Xylographa parallela]|nr:Mitochondrial inner membrane organizing system component [Xylographa parallela]MCJ1432766.1 Mitochondrial inner membrane organizing system component [Xylographa pallens]